jgi:hypothetical protein
MRQAFVRGYYGPEILLLTFWASYRFQMKKLKTTKL